jgi:arsenate reductase
MTTVLFACTHNAGRSQMAAAFFNALADPVKARAESAGTDPVECVHAGVVDAMREVGVDLSGVTPRMLTPEIARGAQLLVTMGCESCPVLPGVRYEEWTLADPAGAPIERVRATRDAVHARVAALIAREGWSASMQPMNRDTHTA